MTSRQSRSVACPWTSESSCREARDAYLNENGWALEAYDAAVTVAAVVGVKISVPITPRHRWAIRLHDLHHVATGYGTDAIGEGEMSAWEWSRGLRGLGLYVGAIVVTGALYGFLLAPRRVWRAWHAPGDRNLFQSSREILRASQGKRDEEREEDAYDELLDLHVDALRAHLGLPPDGVAEGERRLHVLAPRPHPFSDVVNSGARRDQAGTSTA